MPETTEKTVYLIRHGVTDWNKNNRCMGQQDVALNAEGRAQARAVADYFADRPLDRVVASDLWRTRETAAPLCEQKGLRLQTDTRLREICYGELEGLTPEEWPDRFPDLMRTWSFDAYEMAPPGGESRRELIERSAAVLEARTAGDGATVALVAHGGTITALLSYVIFQSADLPVNRSLGVFRVNNGSVTTLSRRGDRWRIHGVNHPIAPG